MRDAGPVGGRCERFSAGGHRLRHERLLSDGKNGHGTRSTILGTGTPTSRYARPRAIRRRAYEERIAGRYARRTVVALDRGRLVAGVEFGGAIKVGAGLADDAVSSRSVSARMGSALDKAVVDGLEGGLLAGRPRPSRLTTMPLKPLLADLGCVRLTDLTVHDVRPAPTTMAAHYPTHTLQKAHNCPTRAIRHAEGHDPVRGKHPGRRRGRTKLKRPGGRRGRRAG